MSSPQSPQSPQQPKQGIACLGVLGVVALVVILLVVINRGGGGSSDDADASPSPYVPSSAPYTPPGDPYTPTTDPYASGDPYSSPSPEPSPYTSGTCLNGTLPDSTTAQSVSGVEEVSCSASDAHYKVIETVPLSTDLSRCNGNPRTQYAFSYRYTLNGATINSYVYCLVGLGSYAR
ncbi:LppU/SCO3897 family protein [Streptomyces lasalocidi]